MFILTCRDPSLISQLLRAHDTRFTGNTGEHNIPKKVCSMAFRTKKGATPTLRFGVRLGTRAEYPENTFRRLSINPKVPGQHAEPLASFSTNGIRLGYGAGKESLPERPFLSTKGMPDSLPFFFLTPFLVHMRTSFLCSRA